MNVLIYVFIFFDHFCGAFFFKSNNAVCLLGFHPAVAVLSECVAELKGGTTVVCVKATKGSKECVMQKKPYLVIGTFMT